ncbi:alpha/beta fold hydrolase [Desulfothermus sp.]
MGVNKKKTRDFFRTQDGVELFFEYIDNRKQDTIVFINGLFQCVFNWYPLIDLLDDRYNILLYDLRAQGKSKIQDQEITFDRHVLDLVELTDHLGLKNINIVGMSLGSIIGSMFAINYKERVNKLALLSVTGGARLQMILDDWKYTLELLGDFALFKFIIPWLFSNSFIEKNQDKLDGIINALIERNKLENLLRLINSMLPCPDMEELMNNLEKTCIIIVGEEDALSSKNWIKRLQSSIDNQNEIIFISDAGHSVIEEASHKVAEIITSFI